jgi:hypothetical protein
VSNRHNNPGGDYRAFLEGKIRLASAQGIEVADGDIHPWLKPHARAIVRWALAGGRRAIFASFGLGKTGIQIELMRLILENVWWDGTDRPAALIVLPLGVRQEFHRDAASLGVSLKFIRSAEEIEPGRIHITNYETVRDGKLDPKLFVAASLDEASVLRGFGATKTFREFMRLFEGVRYRFVATATPSPNEYIELLAYAAFLDIMDVGQAKTRFFQRNSEKNDDLTLYPHKEREFWTWVASWAVFVQRPSDLGFDDTGYALPEMVVRWHEVPSDHATAGADKGGQGRLFRNTATSLSDAAREKRDTIDLRVKRVLEIIESEREPQGVPEGLLREEPAAAPGGSARPRQKELRREQGSLQGAVAALEAGQPGALSGAAEAECGAEPREEQGAGPDLVPQQQGTSSEAGSPPEAEALRPYGRELSASARSTGLRVCDLPIIRASGPQALCGPLSQDRAGARPALPRLQRGHRYVQGRPGSGAT